MRPQRTVSAGPEVAAGQGHWMRELNELRQSSLQAVGLALFALGYVWTVGQIMGMHPSFYWLPLAAPLSVTGLGALIVAVRRPLFLRTAICLAGLMAVAAVAVFVQRMPSGPFVYVLVVASATVLTNAAAILVVAGLSTIVLLQVPTLLPGVWSWDTISSAIALAWLAALSAWLSSRNQYTVLVWALRSHEGAQRTLHELQEQRGKLNRTMRALSDANLLLRRTTYDLAEMREEAERARQMKSQFAANISHELRTPLHLIVGFSQVMYNAPETYKRARWTPELRTDVRAIHESAQHLLQLIDDVLDLSQVEVARLPIAKERIDLQPIIHEAVETARSLLRGRSLYLRLNLPGRLPPLYADPTRIRQVLLNLLNNAARFTEVGGITVSALARDDEVEVVVQDTGIGIPPEQVGSIFSEFHQVDASIRRKHGGTGLGLAICRHFIHLHDGRIWVKSTLSEGSAFHFTLPLPAKRVVPTQQPHLPAHWRYPATKPRTPRRVVALAVTREVPQVLRRYLPEGEVIEAADVPEALALTREKQADAIVYAFDPRGADPGDALADATRDLMLPVIGFSFPLQRHQALAEGFTHCLMKPFTGEQLLQTVRSAVPEAERLLVVDDDEGVVRLVRRYLAAAMPQVEVLEAYDGDQAIALLGQRPDAVLLDLVLPKVNGLEVVQEIRSRPETAALPIIAITAYGFEQDVALLGRGIITTRRGRQFSAGEITRWLDLALEQMPARHLRTAEPGPEPAPAPSG